MSFISQIRGQSGSLSMPQSQGRLSAQAMNSQRPNYPSHQAPEIHNEADRWMAIFDCSGLQEDEIDVQISQEDVTVKGCASERFGRQSVPTRGFEGVKFFQCVSIPQDVDPGSVQPRIENGNSGMVVIVSGHKQQPPHPPPIINPRPSYPGPDNWCGDDQGITPLPSQRGSQVGGPSQRRTLASGGGSGSHPSRQSMHHNHGAASMGSAELQGGGGYRPSSTGQSGRTRYRVSKHPTSASHQSKPYANSRTSEPTIRYSYATQGGPRPSQAQGNSFSAGGSRAGSQVGSRPGSRAGSQVGSRVMSRPGSQSFSRGGSQQNMSRAGSQAYAPSASQRMSAAGSQSYQPGGGSQGYSRAGSQNMSRAGSQAYAPSASQRMSAGGSQSYQPGGGSQGYSRAGSQNMSRSGSQAYAPSGSQKMSAAGSQSYQPGGGSQGYSRGGSHNMSRAGSQAGSRASGMYGGSRENLTASGSVRPSTVNTGSTRKPTAYPEARPSAVTGSSRPSSTRYSSRS